MRIACIARTIALAFITVVSVVHFNSPAALAQQESATKQADIPLPDTAIHAHLEPFFIWKTDTYQKCMLDQYPLKDGTKVRATPDAMGYKLSDCVENECTLTIRSTEKKTFRYYEDNKGLLGKLLDKKCVKKTVDFSSSPDVQEKYTASLVMGKGVYPPAADLVQTTKLGKITNLSVTMDEARAVIEYETKPDSDEITIGGETYRIIFD